MEKSFFFAQMGICMIGLGNLIEAKNTHTNEENMEMQTYFQREKSRQKKVYQHVVATEVGEIAKEPFAILTSTFCNLEKYF